MNRWQNSNNNRNSSWARLVYTWFHQSNLHNSNNNLFPIRTRHRAQWGTLHSQLRPTHKEVWHIHLPMPHTLRPVWYIKAEVTLQERFIQALEPILLHTLDCQKASRWPTSQPWRKQHTRRSPLTTQTTKKMIWIKREGSLANLKLFCNILRRQLKLSKPVQFYSI